MTIRPHVYAKEWAALAGRLAKCPEITNLDQPDEPAAWAVAHGLLDVDETLGTFSGRLSRLRNEDLDAGEIRDVLFEIGEDLRHVLHHINDTPFFGYVAGPRVGRSPASSSDRPRDGHRPTAWLPEAVGYHEPAFMHDELTVLRLVTGRLESAGMAYMVTGSVALSLYAQPRMTRDVDLVVELRPSDAARIVEMFGAEFNCDADRIREAIARQSMFNLIHTAAVVKIDIIVRKHTAYRAEEFQRRRLATINGAAMWVVSAEDLVLSKLDWARDSRSEVQLRDVRRIIDAQPLLDWVYIDQWAGRLDVIDLLREVRP